MKMMYRIIGIILITSFAGITVDYGYAESEAEVVWTPTTPGPFITWTAPLCGKNRLNIQPLYFFHITRGTFDAEAGYKSLTYRDYKYQQLIQLFMQFGILEHLELDVQPSWQFNYAKQGNVSAESSGIGDTELTTRLCPFEEGRTLPNITGLFQVKLPTGKYEKSDEGRLRTDIIGTGSTDYSFGLNFTKGIKPVLLHLDLLYTVIPSPVKIDGVKTVYRDIYKANLAAEWVFYKNLNLMGELLLSSQGDKKQDGDKVPSTDQSSLVASVGLGYSENNWQVLIGYQRTVAGENVDANDTVAGTLILTF